MLVFFNFLQRTKRISEGGKVVAPLSAARVEEYNTLFKKQSNNMAATRNVYLGG